MISILGPKRFVVLIALIAFNISCAAIFYNYVTPQISQSERRLKVLKKEGRQQLEDLEEIRLEFDQLVDKLDDYEALDKNGFFEEQDRRVAGTLLERIQKLTNMINARVQIDAATFEGDEDADKAGYQVIATPLIMELEAIEDIDIYRYIYFVENSLPGHVSVQSISMERNRDVTGSLLRAISTGEQDIPPLAEASVRMIWRTMIPIEETQESLNP